MDRPCALSDNCWALGLETTRFALEVGGCDTGTEAVATGALFGPDGRGGLGGGFIPLFATGCGGMSVV